MEDGRKRASCPAQGHFVIRSTPLASGGGIAAGAAMTVGAVEASPEAKAAGGALPAYEKKVIGHAGKLTVGQPVTFTYPDDASPCSLVKIGNAVPGGIGPDGDIVPYCTTWYDAGADRGRVVAGRIMGPAHQSG